MVTLAVNDRITAVMVATGGQTDFPVDFPALKFGGAYAGLYAKRVRGGVTTTLDIDDFDVVTPGPGSFTLRLHAAANADDTYQVYGLFPAGRDLAMVSGGAFVTDTYETDQMGQSAQLQELRRDVALIQGAGLSPVTSVNGLSGAVILTAGDLGAAPVGHSHVIGNVTGLQAALDAKANSGHAHVAGEVSGVFTAAQIPPLDAAKITSGILAAAQVPGLDASKIVSGIIDPSHLPASGGTIVASGDMTSLTGGQQALIAGGTQVLLNDGTLWIYSGAGSKTLTASYTQVSINAAWASITGKPANTVAQAGLASAANKLGYFTGAGAMALADFTAFGRTLAGAADHDAASAAIGNRTMVNFVDYFGGNGDGVTSNDAQFTAAEASAFQIIWLPEGSFKTSRSDSTMKKTYLGPGMVLSSGGTVVLKGYRSTTAVGTMAFGAVGSGYGEGGDTTFSRMTNAVLRDGRQNLSNHYLQAGANADFAFFTNKSGGSGTTAHLAASVAINATTATLNSVEGLANGVVIGFQLDDNADPLDVVTISNIAGNVITFAPPLAHAYTVAGADYVPTFLSLYAHSPQVCVGRRTMNAYQSIIHSHQAEGDSYAIFIRSFADYVGKAGQTDIFDRSTVGAIGGEVSGTQDGNIATVQEWQVNDSGKDIAAYGYLVNLNRTNDTGAKRATWLGHCITSGGSKPIDAFYSMSGPSRTGIDLTLGDFSSAGQRAIQMKTGQRMYFDAATDNTPGSRGRGSWGSVQGDSWIGHDIDGSGEFVDLWAGGVKVWRARPASWNVALGTNFASTLHAAGAATFDSTVDIAGTLGLAVGLNVGGTASIAGSLNLTGAAALGGNATVGGTLGVTGAATFAAVTANGRITANAEVWIPQGSMLRLSLTQQTGFVTDGVHIYLLINGVVQGAVATV